ncbi:MAG: outer membrane protein assembly factor BamD [Nitrospinaceae bacterium]
MEENPENAQAESHHRISPDFHRNPGASLRPLLRAPLRPVSLKPVSILYVLLLSGLLSFVGGCGNAAKDPLIQKANNEWIKGRNHRAVELFKAVLKKNPSGPSAEEALFRLGEIYHFSLGNSAQAIMYFQEVLQMDPKGVFSYDAQKYIAEIVEFAFKDFDQAIIEYQNLINKFDGEDQKADHQFRIASIYYKKQNYEQTLAELEVLLEKYPDSKWAEESRFKIVEILYTLQRCPEAREHYNHFLEKYPKSRFRKEIDFVLASCFEEEGNLQEAYNRFKGLEGKYKYPAVLQMKLQGLQQRMKSKTRKRRR